MANDLFIVSLIVIWMMLLYHIVLTLAGYRYQEKVMNPPRTFPLPNPAPMVSILVPAHNEEKVIEATVRALCSFEYPVGRYEVIVINDRSTDNTGLMVDAMQNDFPMLKPVHVKAPYGGKGKSAALNFGLQFASGSIIAVYDADNTPEKTALRRLVSTLLSDERYAAVVGKFRVINAYRNLLTRFINIETISFQWMVQGGRWNLFKLATIPGTNYVIRREMIRDLGGWDENALAEDTEVSIRIYETGHLICFMPLAVTWEQEPETWRVWLKQRTRWVRGNTYVIAKFTKRLIALRGAKISLDILYFFMTYFMFLGGVLLSDLLFVLSFLHVVHLTLAGPFFVIWLLAYVLFAVEIAVTLEIETTELTWSNFGVILLMYFTYSQLWMFLVVRGMWMQWQSVVHQEAVVWQKTERF